MRSRPRPAETPRLPLPGLAGSSRDADVESATAVMRSDLEQLSRDGGQRGPGAAAATDARAGFPASKLALTGEVARLMLA